MVKIERTPEPPKSLAIEAQKEHGSYRCADVISQLESDFYGKCYLCEIKPLQSVQVEHLRSHDNRKRKDRVFDWNNLFYACPHCNNMKASPKYDENILDCCRVDPEEFLEHRIEDGHVRICPNAATEDVSLTAELLESCFEKRNTGIRVIECQTRMDALNKEMNILYSTLDKYKKEINKNRQYRSLCRNLSRSSRFAAFKRYYVKCHLSDYPELAALLK